MAENYDAVVVGSGPNGLSAAIELARQELSVCVLEASERIGGGTRSAELTEPGFIHDICSAIHPLAGVSPFFREIGLIEGDVSWVHPPAALAHPFEDGTAGIVYPSLERTAEELGADGPAYARLFEPLLRSPVALFEEVLRPVRIPKRPLLMARFGLHAIESCTSLARRAFRGETAKALFAGCAAHASVPLHFAGTSAFALTLLLAAHAYGWPCARGGSQSIANALETRLKAFGGEIRTGVQVRSLKDLPNFRAVLFDLPPKRVVEIAGSELPTRFLARMLCFRHGPGVFKADWALDGPIPWKNPECSLAATVHLGGTLGEIAESERKVWQGGHPSKPFVLLAQPSLFDPTRAPHGKHTVWAYCHVPNGDRTDLTDVMEAQIERFAPGFRKRILARHTFTAMELEHYNPALVGGDIGGGANDLANLLGRPVLRWDPYSTPNRRIYLCGSSTPPGGGVHGMCGYWAARSALRRTFGFT